MPLALAILLWTLAGLAALVLLVLATPLRIELQLAKAEAWRGTVAVRPFGRFGPRIEISDGAAKSKPEPSGKRPPAKRRKRKRRAPRNPTVIARAAVRLVVELLGCFHIRALTVRARFGLHDPAETGQVFGMLTPLVYGTGGMPHASVSVVPVFDRAVLTGSARLDLSLVPITLISPLLRFGWVAFGPGR